MWTLATRDPKKERDNSPGTLPAGFSVVAAIVACILVVVGEEERADQGSKNLKRQSNEARRDLEKEMTRE